MVGVSVVVSALWRWTTVDNQKIERLPDGRQPMHWIYTVAPPWSAGGVIERRCRMARPLLRVVARPRLIKQYSIAQPVLVFTKRSTSGGWPNSAVVIEGERSRNELDVVKKFSPN